jgi:hypothetical protein
MTTDQAIRHFRTQKALALALGVSLQVVHNWTKRGIPLNRQLDIEDLTRGKLKPERRNGKAKG